MMTTPLPTSLQEPIAIVGIGCRFPSANRPDAFWELLKNGVDIIREKPTHRQELEADYDAETDIQASARLGGFIDQVTDFDPQFFQISPREAALIDPQQRLLLETSWEALEDAREIPAQLAGSPTGVFIGMSNRDYAHAKPMRTTTDAHVVTGISNSIAANRLSFVFDFVGPSLVVDTACSSSLVAVHLACQSLWQGESTLALAGGAQLMLSSWVSHRLAAAGFLAEDGRCKTFDSRANGYVRGEGVGMVVLKPLAKARADGNPVYALIRGSAVNQDGRSNGMTAPNPRALTAVIKAAYRQAGVSPGEGQYVEAHGTGTRLGDPMEMKALGEVLSEARAVDNGCFVGSVKTNIGHTEAAAGIAGLIKVALSLKHQQIPPSLHLQTPNPLIRLDRLPLKLVSELTPWPQMPTQRCTQDAPAKIAGVSSFGFGGTNAHIVLAAAPDSQITGFQGVDPEPATDPEADLQQDPGAYQVLTLSAKTEPALQAMAQQYADWLDNHSEFALADVCFSANTGRSQFKHRLTAVAKTNEQLQRQLQAFSQGKETADLISYQLLRQKKIPKVAFLFTGQGAQYENMGRQLYEQEPLFRECINHCADILEGTLSRPLLKILYPNFSDASGSASEPVAENSIHLTAYTQPALFALEYALAKLWQFWGIEPTVLMGHSLGEYVAACLAGVFSLEDALTLVAARGRLMQALPENGMMVSALATVEQIERAIAATELILHSVDRQSAAKNTTENKVVIAGFNGPESTVISGDRASIRAVCQQLEAQQIKFKPLQVSHAFHSSLMLPMVESFEQIAHRIQYYPPTQPIVSTITGKLVDHDMTTPDYWCQQIISPVRFADGMSTLQQQGCEIFLEPGPKPVFLGMGRQCLTRNTSESRVSALWLPSLREQKDDWQQMLSSLGALAIHGLPVNWGQLALSSQAKTVSLPTYPFQRQRYWMPLVTNEPNALPSHLPAAISATDRLTAKQTSVVRQLSQGNLAPLLEQLSTKVSSDSVKQLPEILSALAKLHQHQTKTSETPNLAANIAFDKASTYLDNETTLSKDWNRLHQPSMASEERQQLLREYFGEILSVVLGITPPQLDWEQHLANLGFDSLMATELRRRLETKLNVNVPVEFFAQLNLEQFVEQIRLLIEKSLQPTGKEDLEKAKAQASLWVKSPANADQLSLFCFPHAGGGASFFQPWSKHLPTEIALCPIQLPGHENRQNEMLLTQVKAVVSAIASSLETYLNKPFAIFGHSMGALLAFELAREFRRRKWPLPNHLFVSGYRAPQLPY